MYNQIRPMSFRLAPGLSNLTLDYHEMQFPEHWKSLLKELQAQLRNRPVDEIKLPIADLNKAMRALVPDLIAVEGNADRAGDRPWLISATEINLEALRLIVIAWVRASFSRASSDRLDYILHQLTADQLIWKRKPIELTSWQTYPNGTAKPAHEAQFRLLPDYIASRLSKPNVSFELAHQVLHFRRVPAAPSKQGTELISWPPIEYTDGSKSHYYSFLITITVQTIPFESHPVIHFDFGIRRWVSQQTRPGKNRTSVYLQASVPWLPGLHHSTSFQVAAVNWERGDSGYIMNWSSHLTEILEALNPLHPFPNPRDLFNNPIRGLNLGGSPNAAVVFREGMVPSHPGRPGLTPADRYELAQQVAAALEPDFVFTEALPRVSFGKQSAARNPFTEELSDDTLLERHAFVSKAVGERVRFEIHYQKQETARAFANHICEVFGISSVPTSFPFQFRAEGLNVTVSSQQLGRIGDTLPLDHGIKNRQDRLHRAAEQRISLIQQELPAASDPTVAFVELAGKEHFDGDGDPKQTIRTGFAYTSRLTQFIDVTSGVSLEHRVKQALLDGLRQWGLLPDIGPAVDGASSLNYAGIWLIKRRPGVSWSRDWEYLPVIVFIDSKERTIFASIPGIEGWLSYPEALLALGRGGGKWFRLPAQASNYIQQMLQSEIASSGDTLLLSHAQNLRLTWNWLQDKRLKHDHLEFGDSGARPIQDWPGLRIVRVRSNQSNETPQWYAEQDDRIGLSKGLFRVSERVFASTYGKPVQFKMASTKTSKIEHPSAVVWNPSMYELTVAAMQPGDDPAQLAMVAHQLRDVSIQYGDATALPLVLHLGSLMKEYVQITSYEDDMGDDEE